MTLGSGGQAPFRERLRLARTDRWEILEATALLESRGLVAVAVTSDDPLLILTDAGKAAVRRLLDHPSFGLAVEQSIAYYGSWTEFLLGTVISTGMGQADDTVNLIVSGDLDEAAVRARAVKMGREGVRGVRPLA